MRTYKHLSFEEREAIARALDRHRFTIWRELQRNINKIPSAPRAAIWRAVGGHACLNAARNWPLS